MQKCAKLEVSDEGQITNIISEISCSPQVVTQVPDAWVFGGIGLGLVLLWFIILRPFWAVWAGKKSGEATLSEAKLSEQVAVAEANARIAAAEANKKAEIVEAEAVAEAIGKIGDALEKNPSYNRFQWIKMMEKKPEGSVIYVPTEGNLPILESMRFSEINKKVNRE